MATKAKRHQGAAKRIRLSSCGKMLHSRPYGNHFLSKKSGGRKRGFAQYYEIAKGVRKKTRRMLGI